MRIEELPGDSGGGGGGRGAGELQLRREDGGADGSELKLRGEDGVVAAAGEEEKGEGAGRVIAQAALDAKRAAVGVGARMLFYPTLVYNVVRNQCESHFHWWDQVDEHVLLGAVPFPSDVLRLQKLGVCGVVTLNESYERLVSKSLYEIVIVLCRFLWRIEEILEVLPLLYTDGGVPLLCLRVCATKLLI